MKSRPGDNLMLHKAIDLAEARDVIIVDAGGQLTNAQMGEINAPVAIDGMVVEPGDLILGDGDGVMCIPYDDVETVLEAILAKQKTEKAELDAIAAGTNNRSWTDTTLHARGCSGQEN